jgi:hypothetical protein
MKTTNFLGISLLTYVGLFVSALVVMGSIVQIIPSAEASNTSIIEVLRVVEANTYFSGTRANVDKSTTAIGAKTANPARFTGLAAGTHTVTVSRNYFSYTLKNFKMSTYSDVNTTCTANIPVTFSCTSTECTTSKITVGSRPVRVQAQFGSKYTTWK